MRRSGDFPLTIRRGVRAGRTTLVVHCRPREVAEGADVSDEEAHVGFVVSKAVGGAVVRNSVRRRLRGLVMEMRDTLPPGVDVVVRALPPAASAEYLTLGSDLRSALGTAERRLRERRAGGDR
jgi:ribonuclease P protein component